MIGGDTELSPWELNDIDSHLKNALDLFTLRGAGHGRKDRINRLLRFSDYECMSERLLAAEHILNWAKHDPGIAPVLDCVRRALHEGTSRFHYAKLSADYAGGPEPDPTEPLIFYGMQIAASRIRAARKLLPTTPDILASRKREELKRNPNAASEAAEREAHSGTFDI